MSFSESLRLAQLSVAVRESTLKRLLQVPDGFEGWRPTEASLSFADIAQHLIDADNWLFQKLQIPELPSLQGQAGLVDIHSRADYDGLVEKLREIGERRKILVECLTDADLSRRVFDSRFSGEVEVWWIIVRGNLDHETHHRGQIAACLRIVGSLR
ncbi:MAG: DinB family protein [candidate division Zixibacteria bacterium]|nr:DinB family protein [candidate division Zixibacteria bacterium]